MATRWLVGATMAAWAVSACAQQYHVIDLGNFNGVGNSFASGLSQAGGFAAGEADLTATTQQAFFYSSATGMINIGNFAADPTDSSHGSGVNSSGMVAGYGVHVAGGTFHSFWWTQSSGLHDLGVMTGGTGSIAYGINDSGEIVGTADKTGVPGGTAFTWTQGGGYVSIGGITGPNDAGTATCVNAGGQVGGTDIIVANSYAHGFFYTPGSGFVEIGDFDGGHQDSHVHGINDIGQAVGEATIGTANGGRGTVPFFWSQATGEVNIGSLNPTSPIDIATGINNSSLVCGYSNVAGIGLEGWIWSPGHSISLLNNLLDPVSAANWQILDTDGINNNGVITATAFHPGANGTSRTAAVLLVPVPEPSTLVVVGGLISIVAARRRKRNR